MCHISLISNPTLFPSWTVSVASQLVSGLQPRSCLFYSSSGPHLSSATTLTCYTWLQEKNKTLRWASGTLWANFLPLSPYLVIPPVRESCSGEKPLRSPTHLPLLIPSFAIQHSLPGMPLPYSCLAHFHSAFIKKQKQKPPKTQILPFLRMLF